MAVFAQWIEANPDRVTGYDSALTPLAQLNKLSDAEFVQIANGLEPRTSRLRNPERFSETGAIDGD